MGLVSSKLAKLTSFSSPFCRLFRMLWIDDHIFCKQIVLLHLQSVCIVFLFLPFFVGWDLTTVLNTSDQNRHHDFVPDLTEKTSFIMNMMLITTSSTKIVVSNCCSPTKRTKVIWRSSWFQSWEGEIKDEPEHYCGATK